MASKPFHSIVRITAIHWKKLASDLDRSYSSESVDSIEISNYEGLTVVTSFRNKRKAPTKVLRQLILAWPTSLDPSWFLAYLMTSFLCEARNEDWSKHVAMSGSVRCETPVARVCVKYVVETGRGEGGGCQEAKIEGGYHSELSLWNLR